MFTSTIIDFRREGLQRRGAGTCKGVAYVKFPGRLRIGVSSYMYMYKLLILQCVCVLSVCVCEEVYLCAYLIHGFLKNQIQ